MSCFVVSLASDRRLLFKLSLSPFTEEASKLTRFSPQCRVMILDPIAVWLKWHKEEGYEFSRQLWDSMLKERRLPAVEPHALLGRSEFETSSEEWAKEKTAYGPGSRLQLRLQDGKGRSVIQTVSGGAGNRFKALKGGNGDWPSRGYSQGSPALAVREAFAVALLELVMPRGSQCPAGRIQRFTPVRRQFLA